MANATVDLTTGEVTAEPQVRPFAELLTVLDHGAAHAEASRAMHDLVAAVRDAGKKGTLTITLQVAPLKGSDSQVVVAAQVKSSPPKSEPSAAVFFIGDDGNLSRHDPRKLEMDGLRVVEPKPAKTVNV
jgi:hypothetical protein